MSIIKHAKQIISLSWVVLLAACATLLNEEHQVINVHTNPHSKPFVTNLDTLNRVSPSAIYALRSKNDIVFQFPSDSVNQLVSIEPHLSYKFMVGNLFSGIGIFGYLIDLKSNKRFTYQNDVYVDLRERDPVVYSWDHYNSKKGLIRTSFGIPEGNAFHYPNSPINSRSFGFLGLLGNVEYFFTAQDFLSINCGYLWDFPLPVPAAYDCFDYCVFSDVTFVSAQLFRDMKRYQFGLGLQLSSFKAVMREIPDGGGFEDRITTTFQSRDIGLKVSVQRRFSRFVYLNLNWTPTFYNIDSRQYSEYSHSLYFGVVGKVDIFQFSKTDE